MGQGSEPLALTAETLRTLRRPRTDLTKTDQQDQKAHNLALVLRLLSAEGALTRPQLVKRTGLSAPAVASLVNDLLEDGTVRDIGADGAPRVGKPASLVEIDARSAFVVSVDATRDISFAGAVFDLTGEAIARAEVPHSDLPLPAVEALLSLIHQLIALAPGRIMGIGVAAPGLVDEQGVVHLAHRFGWRDLDLGGIISEATGVRAVISNDVNLRALGIRRFRKRSERDLIVITIDHGVAGAAYVNGQLLLGEQFAAGELGHFKVDTTGHLCSCGGRGCLDPAVSATFLRPRLMHMDAASRSEALVEAGTVLGGVLAPIVNFLNATEIALVGAGDIMTPEFVAATENVIRTRVMPGMSENIVVDAYRDDIDLALMGATHQVLARELGLS